MKGTSAYLHR